MSQAASYTQQIQDCISNQNIVFKPSHDEALVDVNDKPKLHISLLHTLHSSVHVINVDHLGGKHIQQ